MISGTTAVSASTLPREASLRNAGALVLGANYRALGIVRSLGRRGIPVWIVRGRGDLLATTSRFVQRNLIWPEGSEQDRVNFLLQIFEGSTSDFWQLFPTDDNHVAMIARHHQALSQRFTLTTPTWDCLRWAYDKRLTYSLAHKLGIAYPRTYYPHSRKDLEEYDLDFPVILKPAFRRNLNRFTAAKAWQVDDRQSLLQRFDEAAALAPPDTVMVQQLIRGDGNSQFSYACLAKNGRPLASLVARRLRQIPMDFGRFSTYVETVEEQGVVGPATSFLSAVGFTGIVEIEFKRDPADGIFKLLDVNPRVWGWLTLCGRAGIDFPYLLWLLLQGHPIPETTARTGVRWIRASADLPVALLEIFRGKLSARSYLRSLSGPIEDAVFKIGDPVPGMLELPLTAYAKWRQHSRLRDNR